MKTKTLIFPAAWALAQLLPVPAAAHDWPIVIVPGRVTTSARFEAAPGAPQLGPATGNDIALADRVPADRACRLLGTVTASARAFNLLSSRPTHADVDSALRREAMRHGADLLIEPQYVTARQGLMAGGRIRGSAKALACGA